MGNRSDEVAVEGLVKILIKLDPTSWHGSATETLWARAMGADEYRLENVPFYAFDVSYHDTVRAPVRGGMPTFAEVVHRGGHSTYRVIVDESHRRAFAKFWRPLEQLGCTYEAGTITPLLATIDVPPETDIYRVYAHLEEGERAGVWSFEEGHCGHSIS